MPDDSADNLGVKNFTEITLSFLHFLQNFKMANNMAGKRFFGKNWHMTMQTPWGSIILSKPPSHTVSEINSFTQNFKMATKNGVETIFGKNAR